MTMSWEEARRQTLETAREIERRRTALAEREEVLQTDIDNRFTYHSPDNDAGMKHSTVRNACKDMADLLNSVLPEGREKSLAITKLEEVMMWSNAAIARAGR